MAVYIGDRKEAIILLQPRDKRQHLDLVCMGAKRHYRKDGTCKHTEAILLQMKPWYRARVKLTPFGNRS